MSHKRPRTEPHVTIIIYATLALAALVGAQLLPLARQPLLWIPVASANLFLLWGLLRAGREIIRDARPTDLPEPQLVAVRPARPRDGYIDLDADAASIARSVRATPPSQCA